MRALAMALTLTLACILCSTRANRRRRSGQRQKLLRMFTVLPEATKLKFKVAKLKKEHEKNKTWRKENEKRIKNHMSSKQKRSVRSYGVQCS